MKQFPQRMYQERWDVIPSRPKKGLNPWILFILLIGLCTITGIISGLPLW